MRGFVQYISEILYILEGEHKKLLLLISFFLVSSAMDVVSLSLLGPYLSVVLYPDQNFISIFSNIFKNIDVQLNHSRYIIILGVLLLFSFFIKTVLLIFINYKIFSYSQFQQVRLRSLLMDYYQHLDYLTYINRNTSDYINTLNNLAARFSNKIILSFLRIISDGILIIVLLTFLAFENIIVFLLFKFLVVGFFGLYYILFRNRLLSFGKSYNESARTLYQGIQESFDGFKEIRILGVSSYFLNLVKSSAHTFASLYTKSQIINISPRFLVEFITVSFVVIIIVYTQFVNVSHAVLIPTLAVFGLAVLRLVPSGTSLISSFLILRFNRNTVEKLYSDWNSFKIIKESSKVHNTDKEFIHCASFKNITVDKISFKYPRSNKYVLKDLSLTLESNESIGFFGPSGCGKTTIVDCLLGLINPQSGNIKYNGYPITECLSSLHKQVAYLPQQSFLIDDSLCNNIALGSDSSSIDHERLNNCLRLASLDGFVSELPHGVNTMIGERGIRLSGGQRQRIALARAFYHEREILVLDESTSALDNETEQLIVQEIKSLKGKKTFIMIAHRLSTLAHCDKIYHVDDGRILESGSYEDLIIKKNDNR
jgi:ABC-type multidrug transport system fused ATPase/permease subunit